MLLYSFEFKFHSVTNSINKKTRSYYVNAYQTELLWIPRKNLKLEKKELSMIIDVRPCNMVPEGNNIFPRSLLVNVKEESGTFLIILWWANKLAQRYTRSSTYITPRVKGSLHFQGQNSPKNIFYGKNIFNRKIYFSCSSSPLSRGKCWQWPKVNLRAVK